MILELFSKDFKPHFAGHETFHLRYGWLKKAFDEVNNSVENSKKVFSEEAAIATFGVGKNMVAAIRFWANACGVIETDGSVIRPTQIGSLLLAENGLDPYLENPNSMWLLHWILAGNPKHTSIFWLFNFFNGGAFNKDILINGILDFAAVNGWKEPNTKTLNNDVLVLLNTYSVNATPKKGLKEDSLVSPFAELGLIRKGVQSGTGGRFHLGWGDKHGLSKGVFLYALCDFWNKHAKANTLNFQSILLDPGSPGRIFLLTENELAVRLMQIESDTKGLIRWTETAGLKQLIKSKEITHAQMLEFINSEYSIKTQNMVA